MKQIQINNKRIYLFLRIRKTFNFGIEFECVKDWKGFYMDFGLISFDFAIKV